ncbi:MAG: Lipl32 family lipoprotein [Leptospirales bacterium]|nr:Lipl32 family lipoprotein [Leptospirales bacterium]
MKSKLMGAALLAAISLFALAGCKTGHLSSSNSYGGMVSAPYVSYVQYLGYIKPGTRPDGQYNGKNAYYLYFWVPAAIDEVGISMYSPSDATNADFVSQSFKDNFAGDPQSFFDTYLVLERMDIIDPARIRNGGRALQTLATNDDSSEVPANPSGSAYNSLLRAQTDLNDPLKALVRGVYRITLTSFRGDVKGSFVATIGTNIPGVKVAASLEELHKLVNEAQ